MRDLEHAQTRNETLMPPHPDGARRQAKLIGDPTRPAGRLDYTVDNPNLHGIEDKRQKYSFCQAKSERHLTTGAPQDREMEWFERMVLVKEETGASFAEIARRAGLQEDRVRKYAHSKVANPRGLVIRALSRALKVEYLWLRDGIGPKRAGDDPGLTAGTAEKEALDDFATRIRRAREAQGMKLSKAVAGLAVTEARWQALESGTVAPNLVELQVISERLHESLDWLVSGNVAGTLDPVRPTPPKQEFLHERAPPEYVAGKK